MPDVTLTDFVPSDDIEVQWRRILDSFGQGLSGADATNELFWTIASAGIRSKDRHVRLLRVQPELGAGALLPFLASTSRPGIFDIERLEAVSAVYGGRSVVLADRQNSELVKELFSGLARCQRGWGTLLLRVIADSPTHQSLLAALDAIPLSYVEVGRNRSPYFHLPATWEEISKRLPQSLRWRIRKGQKELERRGQLTYREYVTPVDAESLTEEMYRVERRSWKESAGVSITTHDFQQKFYEMAIPLAAHRGHLSAHVLFLDGDPIAFMLGLLGIDGAFLAVKSSFVEDLANLSPGHVLKKFAIERLITRGAKIFDFMGDCDEHKMRWTQDTYENVTLVVYSPSWRGKIARLRSWLGVLRKKRIASDDLPTRQQRAQA